jgi:SAM-dependent methyltransferase
MGYNDFMELYRQPVYYEIAFSFFDSKMQVDAFEEIIEKFSGVKVCRFLDVACGPSLQLREIAKRGYGAVGLDSSREMLDYLRRKAKEEGVRVETVSADMLKFRLKEKVDFAFIMMGSLLVESNEQFLSHLDSVASCLKKGGLYFIQNWLVDWTKRDTRQNWVMEHDGIRVETTYEWLLKDIVNQIGTETLTLDVDEKGKKKKFVDKRDLKIIFPQEFKLLVKTSEKFEFLGWFEGTESKWFLDKPLERAKTLSNINMVLLKRK